ncbi:unnamed protein product [Camellia sinensis]
MGMVMTVALTPWEAKILARSIMGIKWPPPTNGKKNISTLPASESMVMGCRGETLCELCERESKKEAERDFSAG